MTLSGKLFQSLAAATGKARLPTVDSWTCGTTRRLEPAERSDRRPGRSATRTSGPSRAHERYRQTTDKRTTDDIANVNVSSRSLKNNDSSVIHRSHVTAILRVLQRTKFYQSGMIRILSRSVLYQEKNCVFNLDILCTSARSN